MSQAYDRATLDFYAKEASVYAASDAFRPSPHLTGWLARLMPGARILELGCGGGYDGVVRRWIAVTART